MFYGWIGKYLQFYTQKVAYLDLWHHPAVNFCRLLITFENSLEPDQDQIWIQSVWHSDSVPEIIFWKNLFWKSQQKTTEV